MQSRAVLTTLLGGATTGIVGGAVWWLVTVAVAAPSRAPGPAGPLLALVAVAAALVGMRLGLSALACTAYGITSAVPPLRSRSAQLALRLSPAVLRPAVSLLVAGGLALGTATAATADAPLRVTTVTTPGTSPDAGTDLVSLPSPAWSAQADLPSPSWTPPRPASPARAQPDVTLVAAPAARETAPSADVVVRRGDTLWSIAARQLGPGATTADVAEAWPRWWQANRRRIGDDPDLLLPGQVLTAPPAAATR
jgi:hypothetical protein